MRIFLTVFLLMLAVSAIPAADQPKVESHKLVLSPASAPFPVRKYRLQVELIEQHPGNAAKHYKAAALLLKGKFSAAQSEEIDEMLKAPLAEFPKENARVLINLAEPVLAEVQVGTRCESCDWELSEEIRKKGIGFILTGIQEMREVATLLQIKIRLDLAEGKTHKALQSARTMIILARHVAESPTLITNLVGIAITAMACERLEEIVQQPDAPNLYWALRDLPSPLFDFRKALEGERLTAYHALPGTADLLNNPDSLPATREQLKKFAGSMAGDAEIRKFRASAYVTGGAILLKHEAAKKALIASGRPRQRVEQMPPLQVAVLHGYLEYDQQLDEMLKWQNFPYWEARPKMEELDKKLRPTARFLNDLVLADFEGEWPAFPFARLLLPALGKVSRASPNGPPHLRTYLCRSDTNVCRVTWRRFARATRRHQGSTCTPGSGDRRSVSLHSNGHESDLGGAAVSGGETGICVGAGV